MTSACTQLHVQLTQRVSCSSCVVQHRSQLCQIGSIIWCCCFTLENNLLSLCSHTPAVREPCLCRRQEYSTAASEHDDFDVSFQISNSYLFDVYGGRSSKMIVNFANNLSRELVPCSTERMYRKMPNVISANLYVFLLVFNMSLNFQHFFPKQVTYWVAWRK